MCPNGHSLSWGKKDSELDKLKEKVKDLQTKLDASLKEVEAYKQKVEVLSTKLEIWEPSADNGTTTVHGGTSS